MGKRRIRPAIKKVDRSANSSSANGTKTASAAVVASTRKNPTTVSGILTFILVAIAVWNFHDGKLIEFFSLIRGVGQKWTKRGVTRTKITARELPKNETVPIIKEENAVETATILDPVLAKSLLRQNGQGWTLNQVPVYPNYECKWLEFTSTTGHHAKFCGHSGEAEAVTRAIETTGRFHHCNILPTLWNNVPDKTSNSIYIEIGANIGSCVVEMLLSTDAKIVLFEPHPKNLFVINSTIHANPHFVDRVVISPLALGDSSATNTIHSPSTNMGNSVVGTIVKDGPSQKFEDKDKHTIFVERLDSIIRSDDGVDVPLIKMDAQGFECHVVDGIGMELAKKIRKIKFEVAPKWLRGQGCHDLLSKLRDKGFVITTENGRTVEGEWQQFGRMVELHAVRP